MQSCHMSTVGNLLYKSLIYSPCHYSSSSMKHLILLCTSIFLSHPTLLNVSRGVTFHLKIAALYYQLILTVPGTPLMLVQSGPVNLITFIMPHHLFYCERNHCHHKTSGTCCYVSFALLLFSHPRYLPAYQSKIECGNVLYVLIFYFYFYFFYNN